MTAGNALMPLGQIGDPSRRRRSSAMSRAGSEASSIGSQSKRMSVARHHKMQIELDNHFSSKIYTTSSPVKGHVVVETHQDMRFDAVQILLVGTTHTWVDGLHAPQQTSHTFLRMDMPIDEAAYPTPRLLEAGSSYRFPFHFVIPNQLTLNACNHRHSSSLLQQSHLYLPPSLGFWEKDDLAPDMAKVEYCLRARVIRIDDARGTKLKLLDDSKRIRVLPAYEEQPPLNIAPNDLEYRLSKSKMVRKNLLVSKQGRLTASAQQPGAVFLQPDGVPSAGTMANVNLKFEPASRDIRPPQITAVAARLNALTYYSAGPTSAFPNLGGGACDLALGRRGFYSTSVPLFSAATDKARWSERPAPRNRRVSGYVSTAPEGGTESERDTVANMAAKLLPQSKKSKRSNAASVFYEAVLQIPVNLTAGKKTFVPTFHSCIVSRVYTLKLTISYGTNGTTTVVLPLQVAVDSLNPSAGIEPPTFEEAEEAAADEQFQPRLLQIADQRFRENNTLPGYETLAPPGRSVAVM